MLTSFVSWRFHLPKHFLLLSRALAYRSLCSIFLLSRFVSETLLDFEKQEVEREREKKRGK